MCFEKNVENRAEVYGARKKIIKKIGVKFE